ncbi:hypothetical protein QWM81_12775 [Streptomyces ficellus]|uniref:Uncharacterized protein n=1 Tax=Streptomyces ficellus TaxID=1977088 RepID=A0ABT7Z624_9ACTN|nr:hypothetical protein [Streptomyces ficellus]MDN3294910.1 hypothetical protein [Streptomyces ficellus]
MITERSRTAYTLSADRLARRVFDVLRDVEDTGIAANHVEDAAAKSAEQTAVALGAVRLLGADVLAPYVLTGRTPPVGETAAINMALNALPPAQPPPAAPPEGREEPWVRAWVDWSLVTVLARVDPGDVLVVAPVPAGPPLYDGAAPRRRPPTAEGGSDGHTREGWVPWSVRLGQLSSLALPGLDGPVHQAARSGAMGLARGATRAVLRRDFLTAARITRWLAWLQAEHARLPLDVVRLTEHIALLGGSERITLETAISRRLLGLEPA